MIHLGSGSMKRYRYLPVPTPLGSYSLTFVVAATATTVGTRVAAKLRWLSLRSEGLRRIVRPATQKTRPHWPVKRGRTPASHRVPELPVIPRPVLSHPVYSGPEGYMYRAAVVFPEAIAHPQKQVSSTGRHHNGETAGWKYPEILWNIAK